MSPRAALPVGTWGEISVSQASNGRFKARARFRDQTGATRQIARYGRNRAKARENLREALAEARQHARAGTVPSSATVGEVADLWLATEGGSHPWAHRTRDVYRHMVKSVIKPELAGITVAELTTPVVDRALASILKERGPGSARTAKKCLSGIARLAIRHGALTVNPVREAVSVPSPRSTARALTPAEVEALTDKLRSDDEAVQLDLPDLVEWMLGTGARIGETLAVRRSVLTVGSDGATWEINATVVRARGQGLIVQPRPKTEAGWRVLALPAHLALMLEQRRPAFRWHDAVFPSPRANALRDPSRAAKDLRSVLDRLGFDWVHSHTFRKTVATRLDEAGFSARSIADQLGHAQPSVTMDVYMGRRVVSRDAAKILDR